MTFGSLFAGIGGIDLGFERAGLTCKWHVEHDDYARAILEQHWPQVPKYRDVRYFLGSKRWRRVRAAWYVDVICGGFPCQDISNAGRRAGIEGARSGLWSAFARIVRLLRPKFVVVENVPALTLRGLGRVLGDLATLGYDAEWDCIPAVAVGAPHLRWRIFIVAHTDKPLRQGTEDALCPGGHRAGSSSAVAVSDTQGDGWNKGRQGNATEGQERRHADRSGFDEDVPNSECSGQQGAHLLQPRRDQPIAGGSGQETASIPKSGFAGQRWREQFATYCQGQRNLFWPDLEPWLRRLDDGLSPGIHSIGGIDDHQIYDSQGVTAEVYVAWKILRAMWKHREIAKTSPGLFFDRLCNSVPEVSRESGSGRWFSPSKASQGLQSLWEIFHSKPFKESCDMLGNLLERIGKEECQQAMGLSQEDKGLPRLSFGVPSESAQNSYLQSFLWEQISLAASRSVAPTADGVANRAHQLRCLGNAVLPQIAEWIGRRIIEWRDQ